MGVRMDLECPIFEMFMNIKGGINSIKRGNPLLNLFFVVMCFEINLGWNIDIQILEGFRKDLVCQTFNFKLKCMGILGLGGGGEGGINS